VKVAVVGAGIAGLAAAHALQGSAQVTLYEAQGRLGGQADTHAILAGNRTYPVDSGFMIFNEDDHPAFSAWLAELRVPVRPATLSIGVSDRESGLEYSTHSLAALLGRPRNLLSARFLSLLRDLRRFHSSFPALAAEDPRSLDEVLATARIGRAFCDLYLLPVCRALWNVPVDQVGTWPASSVLPWVMRHRLLPGPVPPAWRIVQGGSASYVEAFTASFNGRIQRRDPVRAIARNPGQVLITSESGRQAFDAVVLACHADEALTLLEDPSREEREILGSIRFRESRVVVHSDARVMPRDPKVWSCWNAVVNGVEAGDCLVTFWMNRLQSLAGDQQLFVSVDPPEPLQRVWSVRHYPTPILDTRAAAVQRRRREISGARNTWYCGAYWRSGLHEDGFTSGVEVAEAIAHVTRVAA